MILLSLLLAVQATDSLPRATPLPPPDAENAAVLAPINAMFAGLAAHDAAAILAQVRPEGSATVSLERADATHSLRTLHWSEFVAGVKPGAQSIEERMSNPAVDIDGDIAMVWGPYQFLVDGRVAHCGVDHFSLVRDGGAWKVLSVTWSQRTQGCNAP